MKKSEIKKAFIDLLNEALLADRKAISNIFRSRYDCSTAMANHAYIRARVSYDKIEIGAIGLVSGLLARLTGYRLYYSADNDGNIIEFKELDK